MSDKERAEERVDPPYATEPLGQLLGMKGDVEATMFTVLMEAATSAQEDLKSIMAGVKAINAAKARLREQMDKVNRDAAEAAVAEIEGRDIDFPPHGLAGTCGYRRVEIAVPDPDSPAGVRFAHACLIDSDMPTRRELEAVMDAMKGKLDSLSEMGEMESLRLQMAMDRFTKMMSTLSNIMKKLSETSQAITQNIK